MAVTLFFSYSHDDEGYRDQIQKHLAPLAHEGLVTFWHDRRIKGGSDLDAAIKAELDSAPVILLLVSSSFLASPYCYSVEMTRAMERHHAGNAVVLPVIVRPCAWHRAPFGRLRAAPKDGKAVTSWLNHDEAYTDIAETVREIVVGLTTPTPSAHTAASAVPPPSRPSGSPTAAAAIATPRRSANVLLKKTFTDLEKHTFLDHAFESIATFFEASLHALSEKNPGVAGRFRRVDAQTFVATIYRDGKQLAACSIHSGGGAFGDAAITYSTDTSARGNSYNERLSVEVNDREMFLHSLGMATMGTHRDEQLSVEEGAELLWSLLTRHLR